MAEKFILTKDVQLERKADKNGDALEENIFDNTFLKTADIFISIGENDEYKATSIFNKLSAPIARQRIVNGQPGTGFSNWRDFNPGFFVSKDIKLFPDNLSISAGYEYDLGKMKDLTKDGVFGAIQNTISGASQFKALYNNYLNSDMAEETKKGLSYQDRINLWKNVPYFQNIDTSSLNSISFSFFWGQAGLYNCELEVVRPIMCLMNCFGFEIDENGFVSSSPFSNKFEVVTNAYSELFNSLKAGEEENKNAAFITSMTQSSSGSSTTSQISNLTSTLNSIYYNVAGSTQVQPCIFRVGAGVIGPVSVSEVNYEFDYTQSDQYGMPYKGKITLNGIKPIFIDSIENQMLIGGANYNNI